MAKTRVITRYRAAKRTLRHKSKGMTIPLAAVAGFVPLASISLKAYKEGGLEAVAPTMCSVLTGYEPRNKSFNIMYMKDGTIPIIGGLLVHKLASKLGINRMLAQAGVPLLRI
jgi:hypothetical protein